MSRPAANPFVVGEPLRAELNTRDDEILDYVDEVAAAAGGASFAFSNIMAAVDPRQVSSAFTMAANQGVAVRVEAPKSGTLVDLAVNIFTQAGNISVALYDAGATTWTRLYTTGAIACPAAGWQIVGAMSVAVVKGTQYYFVVTTDTATTGFGRAAALAASGSFQIPAGFLSSGTKILGLDNGLHPAPATITASSPSGTISVPAIMARVT